jgi:MATE family multidrug resistance protein
VTDTLAAPPTISLRALLTLAWPVILSRSTQVVIGLGDALMVKHLGDEGLAAVSTGAFNSFMVMIFAMGVVFIVSSFAAQLFGAGDKAGARRYGIYGLAVAGLTQVVCFAVIPLVGMSLGLLDYTPEVRDLMYQYIWIRLLSGGAAIGVEALSNFYGGIGNTRLPMLINVGGMIFDLLGNYALIYGKLGFPEMGVAGAALSSTISSWAMFAVFVGVFLLQGRRPENGGTMIPPGMKWSELGRMLRFGLPSGFNWFIEFAAFNLFINVVVAGLGTASVAAFNTVIYINSVSFMPAFGLASAGAIFVGQSIGAGRKDEVPRVLKLTWLTAVGWQGTVSLAYLAIPSILISFFANEEAKQGEFLLVGARMLRLSAAWQLFDATVNTIAEALRAAGDTAFPMWARIALAWLLFIPGSWFVVRKLGGGDVGAVGSMVVYIAVLAGVLYWRFRSGAWREIQLVEGTAPPV